MRRCVTRCTNVAEAAEAEAAGAEAEAVAKVAPKESGQSWKTTLSKRIIYIL